MQKVEGAKAAIESVKSQKKLRMQSLKKSLSTKAKMVASFSKKIAWFPCQSHTTLFHNSAPLVELMDRQLTVCPQWCVGTVSKVFAKSGQVLIKCSEDDGGGTADIPRAFVMAHDEGAKLPAAKITDQMGPAAPLKNGQHVVFLKQVFLMEHCHGERSLSVEKVGSSAHAFKIWRENQQSSLTHHRLHQWSELQIDDFDVDWVAMDPLAAVHHQRFPGDPATGSGLRNLIQKMDDLKARLRLRRSGFYMDRFVFVGPGEGSAWPTVGGDFANFSEDSRDRDSDFDEGDNQRYPLAHPRRPEGRKAYEKQMLKDMFGSKKPSRPELHGAHYLSSIYANAKRVLPMLSDLCATVASHGVGLRSRGAQLMGPYHACQLAWNKYGDDLGSEDRTNEHGGGFSRVVGLLSCRVECDDEHDVEEALLQIKHLHEDKDELLKVWHTERVRADRSVYPLMYRLTVEVEMTMKTVAIQAGEVVDIDKRYQSLCTIEVVALRAKNRAEDEDHEDNEQWVGNLAHVLQQKREAKEKHAAKVRQDEMDTQVPNAKNEAEQRRRLACRQRWLDWYDTCVHVRGDREAGGGGLYCGQTQMRKAEWDEGEDEPELTPVPHGFGTMLYSSGARYDGMWAYGKPHGFGVSVEANGERYQGHYHTGRRDGVGVVAETGADRSCFHGRFVDGHPDCNAAHMKFSMDTSAVYYNEKETHAAIAAAARVAVMAAAMVQEVVGALLAEAMRAIKKIRAQKKSEAAMRVSALEQHELAAKHKKFADERQHTDETFAAKAKQRTGNAILAAAAAAAAATAMALELARSACQAWLDAAAAAKGKGPPPALPSAPINLQLCEEAITTTSLVVEWERTREDQGRAKPEVQGRKKRVTKYVVEQHWGTTITEHKRSLEEVYQGDLHDDLHGPNADHEPKRKGSVLSARKPKQSGAGYICSLHINGLEPFEKYRLRVRGWSPEGWGEWSDFVAAHCLALPPDPPTQLTVGERTSTTFVVHWRASECHHSHVNKYELVYREVQGVNPPAGFTVNPQALGIMEYKAGANSLTPATRYEIRVRAKNDGGWGDWSNAVQAKTML
jgi:hypothetical protein